MESYQDTYEKYSKFCQRIAGIAPQPFEKWMRDRDGVVKPSAVKEFLDVVENTSPLPNGSALPFAPELLVGLTRH